MKILVTERIADKGIEALQKSGMEVLVDVKLSVERDRLLELVKDYDAIIVRSVTKIDEEFFKYATNLKVVGRAGSGVDNINMEAATQRGILVVNTPEANIVSAAEHTIGLLIASSRNIPQANTFIKNRNWDRSAFKGTELQRKTLGIIGLGRIGSLVATRMQSFGMNVIAYDPYITDERFIRFSVGKRTNVKDLIRESDFITVHTPRTEETYGIIGEEEFKVAKKGLRVVNCARGGIINEDALVKAINEGIVASAGIDVLENEPNTTSPLLDLDNVVITPHLGADTVEAQDNVGVTIAHEVISALDGGMVPNAVNLPPLGQQELETLRSYLKLSEVLGKLYHQLEKEPITKIEVVYSGAVANMETSVITLAVLKGVFEPILKEQVNYVNAKLMSKNRGITVVESKESANGDYSNKIRVNIIAKDKTFTVAGTVFAKKDIRILEVNGFEFDVNPMPYMLVANNLDKPGMIGKMGTLMGASKVNIATMQVSRNVKGEEAMMFLTVDSVVDKDTLKLIGDVEGISKINFVRL